ncbi:hypothetical protein B0A50_03498 [Salinomyces thailandicus]|uniref:Uncharacterized protein n=1 Tax=Salinomyces thailandicus TaxID=706561 RepID=A0A4U0U5P5_9PEZI|nr:hypothetical protein B0A50_03498 [Salinomyces thailandica]
MAQAQDWGMGTVNAPFKTLHNEVYPAIEPTSVQLPQPFVVCIVGASRGIGAGIAYNYAKAGATGLVLASRRTSGLESTAAECKKLNPDLKIEIVSCDISSAESVAALADRTKSAFGGRLDVAAINSGYSGPMAGKLDQTDPATFQNAINVNYVGTFLCAKYLIPQLLATEGGAKAFVVTSSLATLIVRGPFANAQYSVSKAAQLKLLENVHEQYHEQGLNAFAIHPGGVKSEMAEESAPEFVQYLTDHPDLCGACAVWLTKDDQKRWLSGRLVSANWDVDELEALKEEIVKQDLYKLGMTGPW